MTETLLTFLPNSADISSATNNAQFGVRNGHRVLDFDDTTAEESKWTEVLPEAYDGAGFDVIITWLAKTAIVGDAVLAAAFERHDAGTDYDTDSFAAEQTTVSTVPGTSGQPKTTTISFSNGAEIDNLTVGEEFRIRVISKTGDSSWTVSGDIQITSVQIEQTGGGGGGGYFVEGTGGASSVVGKGTVTPVASAVDTMAHGDGVNVSGKQSLSLGKDNDVDHPYCFAVGRDIKINKAAGYGQASFGAGYDIEVFGEYCFGQGIDIHLGAGGISRQILFGQGRNINILTNANQSSRYCFGQGKDIYIYNGSVFAQGNSIRSKTENTFAQGRSNYTTEYHDGSSYNGDTNCIFLQGQNNKAYYSPGSGGSGSLGYGFFLQGYDNTSYGTDENSYGCVFLQGRSNQNSGRYNLIQGYECKSGDYSYPNRNSLVQGQQCESYANNAFVQGEESKAGASGSTIFEDCFAQGSYSRAERNNTFAQGTGPRAIRDNQKTWGSNVGSGQAQKSILAQTDNTTDATPLNLVTFTLETDRAYFIDVRLVCRNTTTDTDDAIFYLTAPLLAWRNSSGAANLSTDPQALTRIQSGASAISARLLTSTNDVLLEVTGVAAQTFRWMVEFIFVERRG